MACCSLGIVNFWQGIVEMVLRAICIFLVMIAFLTSIATVSNLSAQRTEVKAVEDLRFDTRSPTGWLLLVTIFAIPFLLLLLTLRFVDVQFINSKVKIILIIDSIITIVFAVCFFCGAVPLAVHAKDWKYWRGRANQNETELYNLNRIISSAEATSAFSFLSCFSLIAVAVWLVLYLVLGWGETEGKYKAIKSGDAAAGRGPGPRVTMVTSESEVKIVTEQQQPEEGLEDEKLEDIQDDKKPEEFQTENLESGELEDGTQ